MGACRGSNSIREDEGSGPRREATISCEDLVPVITGITYEGGHDLLIACDPPMDVSGGFLTTVGATTNPCYYPLLRVGNGKEEVQVTYRIRSASSETWSVDIAFAEMRWLQAAHTRRDQHLDADYLPNCGIEVEIAELEACRPNLPGPPRRVSDEHALLIQAEGWKLESELSGRLEFVMLAPALSPPATEVAEAFVAAATELALLELGATCDRSEEQEFPEDLLVRRCAEQTVQGQFQFSLGCHLSAVPELFCWSQSGFANILANMGPVDPLRTRVEACRTLFRERCADAPAPYYGFDVSPELEGFLWLIYAYLVAGEGCIDTPFPKGILNVMARTDFATMFGMCPEAAYFREHRAAWVDLVLGVAPYGRVWGLDVPGVPVFGQLRHDSHGAWPRFQQDANYEAEDAITIDTTREAWLDGMTQGQDLLTAGHSELDIFKTMGAMHDTTNLLVEGSDARGIVVELRSMLTSKNIDTWVPFTQGLVCSTEILNRPCTAQDQQEAAQEVGELLEVHADALDGAEREFLASLQDLAGGASMLAAAIRIVERAYDLLERKQLWARMRIDVRPPY